MIGGSVLSAANQMNAGKAAVNEGKAIQASKEYEAQQMMVNAGQARATSQRKALAEQKRTRFVQSALQARAAASGGGALDPTIMDLTGDIAQEGDYRRRVALYEGDDATRVYQSGANLKRWEGEQAVRAGEVKRRSAGMGAAATLLSGFAAATAFGKWGEPSVTAAPWSDPGIMETYNQFGAYGTY